jgi:hypothetical protein
VVEVLAAVARVLPYNVSLSLSLSLGRFSPSLEI